MKILISITIFLSLFLGASPLKLNKEELISHAKNGDVKAMLALNKYYNYPETKEGLAYYNKWLALIEKNENGKEILDFAELFYHYKSMFINGNKKYEKLLVLAKDKGSKKALFTLFKYYSNTYQRTKKETLKEQIEKVATKEELENTYIRLKEKNYSRLADEIKQILVKKGFSFEKYNIKKLQETLYQTKLSKEYMKDLLASKDLINIYFTAKLFMKETTIYKKEAAKLYKKALSFTNENSIKKEIYTSLGYYALNTKKNKEKAYEYFNKGIDSKSEDSAYALLELLKKEQNASKKLKEKLLQKPWSKKVYADYLYKGFSASKKESLKYFEELANEGDKEAIINLATRNFDMFKTNFDEEVYKLSKKWQEYILQSDNSELFYRMKIKLSGYLNQYAKEFQKKFIKKKESSENILILRDNFSKYRYRELKKALAFVKKAISYKDKRSSMLLASIYLNQKNLNGAIKIYEHLSEQNDIEAKHELARLYLYGVNFKKESIDVPKAIKYYEEASELGDNKASEKLVNIFLFGDYNEKNRKFINITKAIKYLKILEKKGNKLTWYFLGEAYSIKGLNQNIKKALYYYEKALKENKEDAYFKIAYLLYKHQELDPTLNKAVKYLKEGAKYHDLAGVNHLLGVFYQKGIGVKKDLKKAAHYFKNVESANPYKIERLGFFYKENNDLESAKFCFEIASKRNLKDSIEELKKLK